MLAVGVTRNHSAKGSEKGLMRDGRDNESRVLDAIRARGTRNFTGAEIADEVGLCRQTIYKIITSAQESGSQDRGNLSPWLHGPAQGRKPQALASPRTLRAFRRSELTFRRAGTHADELAPQH